MKYIKIYKKTTNFYANTIHIILLRLYMYEILYEYEERNGS